MNNPPVSQRDPDVERRRALVKVYMLLLRLAEEAENKSSTSGTAMLTNQKIQAPHSAGEALSGE